MVDKAPKQVDLIHQPSALDAAASSRLAFKAAAADRRFETAWEHYMSDAPKDEAKAYNQLSRAYDALPPDKRSHYSTTPGAEQAAAKAPTVEDGMMIMADAKSKQRQDALQQYINGRNADDRSGSSSPAAVGLKDKDTENNQAVQLRKDMENGNTSGDPYKRATYTR